MMDPLHVYLADVLDGQMLEHVNAILQPYYDAVQTYGTLPPPEELDLDEGEVLEIFKTAIGHGVNRIILHSYLDELDLEKQIEPDSLWDGFKANLDYRYAFEKYGAGNWREIGLRLIPSLGFSTGDRVGLILFFFLTLTAAGERELASRIEPLVRILPRCLPLGEKVNEPGTWVMLVA